MALALALALRMSGQDSSTCLPCHRELVEGYLRTGMARSFAPAKDVTPGAYRHEASDEDFSVSLRAGKYLLTRKQGSNIVEKTVEYQFGSGDHARSYFGRDAQGTLIELPVSWYSENAGHWAMSPGYENAQHAGFTRKINERCFFCHSSDSGASERGIGCDRCHGNAADHLKASPNAIVNPAKLTAQRGMDVCLQCHLETTNSTLPGEIPAYGREVFSFKPGQPLTDYALFFDHAPGKGYDDKFEFSSAPYRLFQSACFRNSPDKLTCITCHNPHKPEQDVSRSISACRNCHTLKPNHPAGDDCISCHMPKRRPSDAIHVSITDHLIRRVPDRTDGAGMAVYKGTVVPYYPATIPADSDKQLYLAAAQVKEQSNLAQGIADLENAIARFKPDRAEFYLDLADAYRHNNAPAKAVGAYRETLTRDPKQWRAYYGLGLTTGSVPDLIKASDLAPREPSVYEAISRLQREQGKTQEAAATLRAGLKQAPDSADLHNSLATVLLRLGDNTGAESSAREAVRLRPELSEMRANLATILARNNKFDEARSEFRQSLKLDPPNAAAHSAFGTALAAHRDRAQARDQFEEALRLNPALANTHNNLGTILNRLGDAQGAIREFRAALKIEPAFATAHYNLGDTLANQGQLDEAEHELSLALQYSPGYPAARLKLDEIRQKRKR